MDRSVENESKAKLAFHHVFNELGWKWAGPEFDFDLRSYKARIQQGVLEGRLIYISSERLGDVNASALDIKNELLGQIKQMEAEQV
jgi:hypothetical protein